MAFWGPFLGGLFGGIGGFLGGKAQERAAERHSQQVDNTNAENLAYAREFAQMGVRWRVEDARAAGIHPEAALGMSSPVPPAMQVGETYGGSPEGAALQSMGQNVSRASFQTKTDRQRAETIKNLAVKDAILDVAIKQAQLANYKNTGPALPGYTDGSPIPGQGNMSMGAVEPTQPYKEKAYGPDIAYAKTAGGGLVPVLSEYVADRGGEDNIFIQADHALRNSILPRLGMTDPYQLAPDPKKFPLPDGQVWKYNKVKGGFFPSKAEPRKTLGNKKATWRLKRK